MPSGTEFSRRSFLVSSALGLLAEQPTTGPSLVVRTDPNASDDTFAIQTLIDRAAVLKSTVLLPARPSPYSISAPLRIPGGVSITGEGVGTRLLATKTVDSLLAIAAPPPGNRLGTVANLFLDGGGLAVTGLGLGQSVQRVFQSLTVANCTLSGIRLQGGQNNAFLSVNIENNGSDGGLDRGAGLELLDGAGNNLFLRCEFNKNGGYQLAVRGPGTEAGTFSAGPTGNTFLCCVFEREAANTVGAILAAAGRMNAFFRCDISHKGSTTIIAPTVPEHGPQLWHFDTCAFSGSSSSVLLSGEGAWGWVLEGCLVENFRRFSSGTQPATIRVRNCQVSNVGDWEAQRTAFADPLEFVGSDWNTSHLVLGRYHFWVDPAGRLRISQGPPKGPTDGTTVGSSS